jgi:hypothetical protein
MPINPSSDEEPWNEGLKVREAGEFDLILENPSEAIIFGRYG